MTQVLAFFVIAQRKPEQRLRLLQSLRVPAYASSVQTPAEADFTSNYATSRDEFGIFSCARQPQRLGTISHVCHSCNDREEDKLKSLRAAACIDVSSHHPRCQCRGFRKTVVDKDPMRREVVTTLLTCFSSCITTARPESITTSCILPLCSSFAGISSTWTMSTAALIDHCTEVCSSRINETISIPLRIHIFPSGYTRVGRAYFLTFICGWSRVAKQVLR